MEYKGIVKTRTTERKIFLAICIAILVYLSIEVGNFFYTVTAVLLFPVVFFEKEHILNEEGSIIRFSILGIKFSDNFWPWEEIRAVSPDYDKAKPNVLLEINRDVTIRAFIFRRNEIDNVLEFCKKMNPDMYVDDRSEAERARAKEEHDAKLAYAKERAKAEKKAKKKKK